MKISRNHVTIIDFVKHSKPPIPYKITYTIAKPQETRPRKKKKRKPNKMEDPPESPPESPPLPPSKHSDARLSLPPALRLSFATLTSFLLGATLGLSHGAQRSGLRFRAENAHRLPHTPTGWFLYHKSKNYHMALGGIREGLKMGAKTSFWVATFFAVENGWDEVRGTRDFFNTVMASLSVAGGFSLWSELFLFFILASGCIT